MSEAEGLMILVAGPYRSGTGDDRDKMAANVRAMEAYALPLFRAGHIPVVGEWLALPLVALAGSRRVGDEAFDEIFHPIAERLLTHCDAVLRVGGPSQGADLMVRTAAELGLRVFHRLSDVPGCASAVEPTGEAEPNVRQAVPFFMISNMEASVRFYVDGLGFEITHRWVGDDGKLRWCCMRNGEAALMLQEYSREGHGGGRPEGKLGLGVSICFVCRDALAIYREARARGVAAQTPFVGNAMWVTSLTDPDGYRIDFESPTDVPEETVYSDPSGPAGGAR